MEAHSAAKAEYIASYKRILIGCIEKSGLPLQIQKIIAEVFSISIRVNRTFVSNRIEERLREVSKMLKNLVWELNKFLIEWLPDGNEVDFD